MVTTRTRRYGRVVILTGGLFWIFELPKGA
jgi:hypothetical protein